MKKQKYPDGSNWKKILNEIYNHSPNSWCESNKCGRNDDNHPIAKKLKISGQELMLGISFLEDHKLIENVRGNRKDYWAFWKLTEKGFNVVLENQKQDSSERLQEIIAIGTVVLVLITLSNHIQFTNDAGIIKEIGVIIFAFFILVCVITMIGVVWPIIKKRTDEIFPDKK